MPYNPPLVISLHGMNQDANYQKGQANWEAVADTAKFVVVYPNGINKAWDISGDTDIKFLETIIDTMYNRYHINRNRVYLSGFSMGGMPIIIFQCIPRCTDIRRNPQYAQSIWTFLARLAAPFILTNLKT